MKKQYNVSVVGLGGMGQNYVKEWKEIGHNVVSVVDVNGELAEKVAKENNVPKFFTDYKKAASDSDVDIVCAVTPLKFHAPITVFAANNGKHVFAEKPMTGSIEEAKAMEEAVTKNNVKYGLGHQRAWSDDVKLLRKWVEEDKFGHPLVVQIDYRNEVRIKKGGLVKLAMHDYYGNKGPVVDIGSHSYIMWQNILNSRVRKVYAKGRVLAKNRPELSSIDKLAWDTALIIMEYESGVIQSYNITWGMERNTTMKSGGQRIFGPEGGAEISPTRKVVLHQGGKTEVIEFMGDAKGNVIGAKMRKEQFRKFADAIEKDGEPLVGLQEGKDTVAVMVSILKSIETGKEVEVEYF